MTGEPKKGSLSSEAARVEAEAGNERLRRELSQAQSTIDFYKQREAHFSRVLKVADGGMYRADWAGAIHRVVEERNELRDVVKALRGEITRFHTSTQRLLSYSTETEVVTPQPEVVAGE